MKFVCTLPICKMLNNRKVTVWSIFCMGTVQIGFDADARVYAESPVQVDGKY